MAANRNTLSLVLESIAVSDDVYSLQAPLEWGQGRTLYGGLTAALMLHVARMKFADLPPLRSAQIAFVGPTEGQVSLHADLLRKGRSSVVVAVSLRSAAGVAAQTLFTFGHARKSQIFHAANLSQPVPPPADCDPLFPENLAQAPPFLKHFDLRLAAGSRPFSGSPDPAFMVWARLLDVGSGVHPEVELLALGDATPPAATACFPGIMPVSTMTWTLNFVRPIESGGYRLLWNNSEDASDGYSQQMMHIFDDAGSPLVIAQQTVALFY